MNRGAGRGRLDKGPDGPGGLWACAPTCSMQKTGRSSTRGGYGWIVSESGYPGLHSNRSSLRRVELEVCIGLGRRGEE